MTIVCATHFTDASFDAVKTAAALARVHGERLCLLRVVEPLQISTPSDELLTDALQLHATALTDDGVKTETAFLHGTLERTVRQYCADRAATLLVVGDSSESTSSKLVGPLHVFKDGVDVPLLVVRDPRPFEAWALGVQRLKVMLAIDHTWSSSVARDWISQLSDYGPVDLLAVFVWWPPAEDERHGTPTATKQDAHTAMNALLEREIGTALRGLPKNVKCRVQLELGQTHVADTLLAMAEREQVDLLVLGSHPVRGLISRLKGRFGVSDSVLLDAPMSVACIPSHGSPRLRVLQPPAPPEDAITDSAGVPTLE